VEEEEKRRIRRRRNNQAKPTEMGESNKIQPATRVNKKNK